MNPRSGGRVGGAANPRSLPYALFDCRVHGGRDVLYGAACGVCTAGKFQCAQKHGGDRCKAGKFHCDVSLTGAKHNRTKYFEDTPIAVYSKRSPLAAELDVCE